MSDQLNFSPAAWVLLEMLQQLAGVSLEIVHVWLHPVRQAPSGEFAAAIEEPGIAEEALKAVRTGEVRIDASRATAFGIFPLRRAREIVGCLIVTRRRAATEGANTAADIQLLERAGALARTALESDLELTAQVAQTQAMTRRLHGILRFVGQLGAYETDREVMNAVLQAATVWFDLDCRIYQREPDGSFRLAGFLPGAEQPAAGLRIDAVRAEQLLEARRFPSAGDLDDLGLTGRRDEVLLLPVGLGRPEWIILLAGMLDSNAELTFTAIARVLSGELQARELTRIERWQDRLAATPPELLRAPERVILRLLEELAAETGASGGRVTLVQNGTERVLAAFGPQGPDRPPSAAPIPPERDQGRLSTTLQVAVGATIRIDLWAAGSLARGAAIAVQAWIKAVRPWLVEALADIAEETKRFENAIEAAAFERRIHEEVERAKRFNLGLGLVLIGTEPARPVTMLEAVVQALRPELRTSDLLGRIRGGVLAVVLVHAGSEAAESLVARLRHRLESMPHEVPLGAVRLGKAIFSPEFPTAEALIAEALSHAFSLNQD
jgi:hypothetical protein